MHALLNANFLPEQFTWKAQRPLVEGGRGRGEAKKRSSGNFEIDPGNEIGAKTKLLKRVTAHDGLYINTSQSYVNRIALLNYWFYTFLNQQ